MRRARSAVGGAVLVGLAALPAPALSAPARFAPAARPVPLSTWTLTDALLTLLRQNPCLSDDLAATRLSRFPEGLALLRMRADLDAAERLESAQLAREARASNGQLARLRTSLDSMVRFVERQNVSDARGARARPQAVDERRAITARVRGLATDVDSVVQVMILRADAMDEIAPAGYLGVRLSSVPVRQALRSGYVVSYCEYPVVESVDPGSPAERGGVRAGDTLVAFNGRDVLSNVVDYTALLVPGQSVRLAVRRSGRRAELPLTVVARPEPTSPRFIARVETVRGTSGRDARGVEPADPERARARTIWMQRAGQAQWPGNGGVFVFEAPGGAWRVDSLQQFFVKRDSLGAVLQATPPSAPRAPFRGAVVRNLPARVVDARRAPSPGLPPTVPAMVGFAPNADVVLAGAKLQTLGAELRASLALPEGVLVLEVLRGTPAFESGLRAGDVIQRADARPVRRVEDVRDALGAASGAAYVAAAEAAGSAVRTLSLRVIDSRQGTARTVQLRW